MLYAIISQDVENSLKKRISVRPDHIDRLNKLKDEQNKYFGRNSC